MNFLLGFLLVIVALFLIMIVLLQRGRGGGLTGALGGMGGQSAFGAKAGDVFTRITIVTAAIWILLCVVTVKLVGSGGGDPLNLGGANVPATGEVDKPFVPSTGSGKSNDKAAPAAKQSAPPAEPAPPAKESAPEK